ncbi:microtubule interacting and transport domain-containing protein (MIT) [Tieghemostelium lacteum]|uniref:Microtubule interacting and transport domain-containing protein (MIT) n=1 Tax=Tieghemostelium lacteum TaxID=361077 RepID=A0A151Z7W5_TIELA|nr:microtubule interacting and transport domain-containing protein (MIT) [Tieghemostelium lacteum]|eukprot:KYQ90059.1 microtubule interacting and transport domain-containing protein (MIT) [Tieghemostelium lacteum]
MVFIQLYLSIIIVFLLYNCVDLYSIVDYSLENSNNVYAQNIDSCDFVYRISIQADIGDLDIGIVTSTIVGNSISVISSSARQYYFEYRVNVQLGQDTLQNLFEVNGVNIGGTIEYNCESMPHPLVNLNPNKEFMRVNVNSYYLLLIFNLKKAIPTTGFTITYPYPNTYGCSYKSQGYRLISILCNLVGFDDFQITEIDFGIQDPQLRTTTFTFKTFIDLSFIRNGVVTFNQYSDYENLAMSPKQNYYVAHIENYTIPLLFIDSIQDQGNVICYNVPITGSYDYKYEVLYFMLMETDGTYELTINNLNGNSSSTMGEITITTTNTNDGTATTVTPIANGPYSIDFESTVEITDYLPFTIVCNFGSFSKEITYTYPYGIMGRNSLAAQATIAFMLPPYNSNLDVTAISNIVYNNTVNSSLPIDNVLPVLESLEIIQIDSTSFLIKVRASDDNAIYFIEINSGTYISFNAWTLVEGTLQNGTFTKFLNVSYLSDSYDPSSVYINIYDMAGNKQTYNDFYGNSIPIPPLLPWVDPTYTQASSEIIFLRYSMNDIDLSIIGCDNTLFVNFSNSIIDEILMVKFSFGTYHRVYYGQWNYDQDMFSVDFHLNPKLFSGVIEYSITYRQMLYESRFFLDESWQLQVTSDLADIMPPVFTDSLNLGGPTTSAGGQIQWMFPLSEFDSGFKEGYLLVYSDVDPYVPFNISLPAPSDIYSGYIVPMLDVPPNCVTQTFYIETIVLVDLVGNVGTYTSGNKKPKLVTDISPMMRLLKFTYQMSQLAVAADCQVTETDLSPPEIVDCQIYTNNPNDNSSVNLFSTYRSIYVNFTIQDGSSIISPRHIPKCYIHALLFDVIESTKSEVVSTDNSTFTASYHCQIDLPYGLGYPNDHLLLSINGFADVRLNFGGLSPNDLVMYDFSSTIPVTFIKQPIIESINPVPSDQSSISIFGYGFGVDVSEMVLKVYYEDSTSEDLQSVFQSDTFLIADGIKLNQSSFSIKAVNSYYESNSLSVEPYLVPFKPRIPCLGNPVCGGPSNGICTLYGCVCKYPWTSNDCMSQIVIIPPPTINSSNPDISNNYTTTLPGGGDVTLSSLIKIVALREMSPDNKAVSTFQFTSWIFTNTTPSRSNYQEYQYRTSLTSNNKTSNIKVTIQYFSTLSIVYFANQRIQMLPSTIKYRVEMTPFGFTSELNYIQLLMSTSLTSYGNDSCSFQDQGSIVNSNMDYVRLQINDNSLYCRYIKKGVIDNRIQDISNTFYEPEGNQSTVYLNREIGINIPYYKYNMLIDPDFSILADILPASERPGSVCVPLLYGTDDSSGLTQLQIIGIIVGCVGFIVCGALGILLYKLIVNWDFKVKFWRKVDKFIKMKKLNKL